jgi:hypothetical protein
MEAEKRNGSKWPQFLLGLKKTTTITATIAD